MQLFSILRVRLQQALHMAVTDLEDGHAPDPYRYAEYDLDQPAFLRRIEKNLRQGVFRPSQLLELSFPKSEFAVRPGRRIELEDLVVLYYALISIANDLEDRLKPGVTAYRVRKGNPPRIVQQTTYILPKSVRRRLRFITPGYNAWPGFIRRLRREYDQQGRKFLGLSDITAFYEDVDLDILREVLRSHVRRETRPLVNLLVEMYQSWSTRDVHLVRQNRGLPQGTTSSGPIANYYLLPFDEQIDNYARRANLRWYRYNDDMRLLGKEREKVRLGLREVGQGLRRLNLIQQAAKTKLLTGMPARRELFDQRPERISKMITQIRRSRSIGPRRRNSMLRRLDSILHGIKDPTERNDSRVLAMLYAGYGELQSDRLLRRWKKDYLQQPHRARTILSYVARFLDRRGQSGLLVSVLENQKSRATDWELAQFLRVLRRAKYLSPGADKLLRSLAQSKTANWYVRKQVILAIDWFSLSAEVRRLARILDTEWDDEVRRAILPVLFLLPPQEESALLLAAARDLSPKVSRMANFLLRLRSDPQLAHFNLRKFRTPNEIFFADSFWRLYQIRWQQDLNVMRDLRRVLQRTRQGLKGQFARRHMQELLGATVTRPARPVRSRAPRPVAVTI